MSRWLRPMAATVAAVVAISTSPTATDSVPSAPYPVSGELARGKWALLFAVFPGCPACEDAIGWLGEVYHAYPRIQFLLVVPWMNEELEAAASRLGLSLVVDKGGRMGAAWSVRRAPVLVFHLDGRPHGRLDWPFTEAELVLGLEELAASPREGPWQFLGAVVPLGEARILARDPVNLAELPRPLLVLFFNPDYPPCWDALPGLVELCERVLLVVVVLSSHALAGSDRDKLREAGCMVMCDDERDPVRTLAVRATPTYVILDAEGVIRWVHEGIVEQEVLRSAVLAVVSEDGTDE